MIPASYDGGSMPLESPIAVKEAVMPFSRFRRPDGSLLYSLLSPEMKSTGEVMGLALNFGAAYAKAQAGASSDLPTEGNVFVSVANADKRTMVFPIQRLSTMGFKLLATAGTAQMLRRNGIDCEIVAKQTNVREDQGDDYEVIPGQIHTDADGHRSIVDLIHAGEVDLILNTPAGSSGARHDGYEIRAAAVNNNVPCITTVQGAVAAVQGMEARQIQEFDVLPIQELHP